jgi:hypothetical protein
VHRIARGFPAIGSWASSRHRLSRSLPGSFPQGWRRG